MTRYYFHALNILFHLNEDKLIIINNNIHLFNVQYNINSYDKNYDIANKFRQNPRRHVYCFDYKVTLRAFTMDDTNNVVGME